MILKQLFSPIIDSNANSQLMEFLADCALRLTKDGDKVNQLIRTRSFLLVILFTPAFKHDRIINGHVKFCVYCFMMLVRLFSPLQ